ncbi:hypothetical protein WBP06_26035 [Novosphingobium sp. BL-8H]|uniref:hypothetical protein n=1 Tax=Novosphingobium sp. BL-8H TaxID=3127640 RepID=UPI00375727BB
MERKYLHWVVPLNLLPIVFVWPAVSIFAFINAINKDGWSLRGELWNFTYISIFGGAFFLFPLLSSARIYRVSYDGDAVYQRGARDFERSITKVMRYEDIYSIVGDPGRGLNFGKPFEFVRIYRKDWDGQELFMLSPNYLHQRELKFLLRFIFQKRPDAFSQEIIDYMNNDRL